MNHLNSEFIFTPASCDEDNVYPYIRLKDKYNGTHYGYLNLSQMNTKQKLAVLSQIITDNAKDLMNPTIAGAI